MTLIIDEFGKAIYTVDENLDFDETVTPPQQMPTLEERLEACEEAITEIAEVIANG